MSELETELHTEPTVAMRVWRVAQSYGQVRLASPSNHAALHGIWEPFKEFAAYCSKCKNPEDLYECECGIYAWDPASAEGWQSFKMGLDPDTYVVGEVKMWGHVQVNSLAHRASHAYPECLYVFNDHHTPEQIAKIEKIAEAYGIDVKHIDLDVQKFNKSKVLDNESLVKKITRLIPRLSKKIT